MLRLWVKKCFLTFRENPPRFCLCLLPLVLSQGTAENLLYILPSGINKILLSLLFSRLNSPSHRFLIEKWSRPLIIFVALCWALSRMSMSLLYCRAQNWTQDSTCGLISAEEGVRITSPDLLAVLCLMQCRMPFALSTTRERCWLMVNMVSTSSAPVPSLSADLLFTCKFDREKTGLAFYHGGHLTNY